jgi:multiple sugar transport system permease protein
MMTWRTKNRPIALLITVVLLIFMLFPFAIMITTMLRGANEIYVRPPRWIPDVPTFGNLISVWSEFNLRSYFESSMIVAVGTTLLNMALAIPAAYAVARLRFPGRSSALYLFLAIQMFSPVIIVISLFRIFARAGLIDSYWSLVLANTVFTMSFTVWMMTGYFRSIPLEIEEAARIDGCTRVQTIWRVMLPIAAPGLVTAMIYAFIWAWNEFLFALSFIKSAEMMPLTLGIYRFVGRWSTQWEMLTASAFLALIPVVVLFYIIERRLVQGLAGGAVKG